MAENDRVVLGHHSLRSDSLATYSRDLLGAATRSLCGLIAEVRLGVFDPDGTRSGWLLQQAGAAIGAGLDENQAYWADAQGSEAEREGAFVISGDESEDVERPVDDPTWGQEAGHPEAEEMEHYAPVFDPGEDEGTEGIPSVAEETTGDMDQTQPAEAFEESSSAASSSSLSAESSGEECEESFCQQQSNEAILHVSPEIPGPLAQNKRSKILHKLHEVKVDLAACGLKVTAGYVKLPNGATFAWPRCSRCFRGEVLSNRRDLVNFIDQRAKSSA
jgi:hypothetical protein